MGYSNNINSKNMELDYVTKRDGSEEEIQFDKILARIKNLSEKLTINPSKVTQKVCSQIYPNIKTSEIDELAGQICASLSTEHPDYGCLASNIVISNHHKNTFPSFTETITDFVFSARIFTSLYSCFDLSAFVLALFSSNLLSSISIVNA